MAEYREREWAWMKFVSKEYGLTVNFGTAPQPGVTEQMDRLDDALAEGADITAQVLVRPQALLLSWESRVHPFTQTRMFNEIKQLPLSEWPARLSDMSVRGEMIAQAEELVNEDSMQGRLVRSMFGVNTVTSANDSSFKRPDMDMMTYYYPIVGTCQPARHILCAFFREASRKLCRAEGWDYEPLPEQSIAALASAAGKSPFEICYDHMMSAECTGTIWRGTPNVVRVSCPRFLSLIAPAVSLT